MKYLQPNRYSVPLSFHGLTGHVLGVPLLTAGLCTVNHLYIRNLFEDPNNQTVKK